MKLRVMILGFMAAGGRKYEEILVGNGHSL